VPAAPAPAVREAALPSSERADPSKEKTPAQPSQRPARAPSATQAVLEPRDGKALAEFERAEQALAANNPEEALFRAQRSLGAEPSGRARSVVTRAHCALRDLGNARAQFQNVPGPLRPACKQWCAKFDIDLGSP
jgi:hypothetical protein